MFLALLQQLFLSVFQQPCPVVDVEVEEGDWVFFTLNQNLLQQPSRATLEIVQQGYYIADDGQKLYQAVWDPVLPPIFYHGTNVSALINCLKSGSIRGSHDIGEKPCNPRGVYSYGFAQVSDRSTYVAQGAQLQFQNPSLAISLRAGQNFDSVPEGVILRRGRTQWKKHGHSAWEYVHNSKSIGILSCKVKSGILLQHLQGLLPAGWSPSMSLAPPLICKQIFIVVVDG